MTQAAGYTIATACWETDADVIAAIRHQVFVLEQSVPQERACDEFDANCRHLLAVADDGTPIGSGRLLADAHIGRVAVISDWRGGGVGKALMRALIDVAGDLGHHHVALNAQTHAVDFYRQLGFEPHGQEFMDAGIAHMQMTMQLPARQGIPVVHRFSKK